MVCGYQGGMGGRGRVSCQRGAHAAGVAEEILMHVPSGADFLRAEVDGLPRLVAVAAIPSAKKEREDEGGDYHARYSAHDSRS